MQLGILLLVLLLTDRHSQAGFVHSNPIDHSVGRRRKNESLDDPIPFLSHIVQIEALKMLRVEYVIGAELITQRAAAALPVRPARH
jgi:hypothetical protein